MQIFNLIWKRNDNWCCHFTVNETIILKLKNEKACKSYNLQAYVLGRNPFCRGTPTRTEDPLLPKQVR
jgi:hypothetical protein